MCDIWLKNVSLRDHWHIAGKYRGSSHKICNANYRFKKIISAMFHNLTLYDSHNIMQKICMFEEKINVIPNGLEKNMWPAC